LCISWQTKYFDNIKRHGTTVKSSFSTCALNGHLLTVTIPDAVLTQFNLLRMSKILHETCTC